MKKLLFAALVVSLGWQMGGQAYAAQGTYDVVYPMSRQESKERDVAPSLPDLNGKRICEVWNYSFKGEETYPILETLLREQYPKVEFVGYDNFGNIHGYDEVAVNAALPGNLKKFQCDAVIAGNGG